VNRGSALPAARGGHCSADLQTLFDQLFLPDYHTRLEGGGDEPVYLPADGEHTCHRIIFRADYFSSALHEVAHWCIAQQPRRQQIDYGYWYVGDGRNAEQQNRFEQVEARPQALEWIFSVACGLRFRPSYDNLNGTIMQRSGFNQAIYTQLLRYCERGLPDRAGQFRGALCHFYGTRIALDKADFDPDSL
jgi:hypothetical protein